MQFKKTLLPYLVQALDPKLLERGNEGALKKRIEELVDERLTADKVPIGRQLRVKLLGDIIDEMVGFGPLEQLLKDDTITEIMVNGHQTIYTEQKGRLSLSPIKFLDVESCRRVIDKILSPLGRRVDESSPLLRRAPARRLARQRHHPAAGPQRPRPSPSVNSPSRR